MTTTTTAAIAADPRRRTEADPDYARLQAQTEKRLHACIARLCADLRSGRVQPTVAQSVFIHTATAVLESAYTEAHAEGQRDYWQRVSATPHQQPLVAPDEGKLRHRLAFYAPSVAKMAHEALLAHQAALAGRTLSEVLPERAAAGVIMRLDAGGGHAPGYDQNRDAHGRWAPGDGRADSGGGGSSGGEEEGGTRAEGGTRGTRGQGRGARSGGASGAGGGRGGARARRQGQPQDEQQQARRQQREEQQREEAQRAEQEGHARAEEMHARAVERRSGGQRRAGGGAARRAQPTAEERATRELEEAKVYQQRVQRYVQQTKERAERAADAAREARQREQGAPAKAREQLRKEAIQQAKHDGTPEYREYQKALREQRAAQREVDRTRPEVDRQMGELQRIGEESRAMGHDPLKPGYDPHVHPEYEQIWHDFMQASDRWGHALERQEAADNAVKAATDRVVGEHANDAAVANHPLVLRAHENSRLAGERWQQAIDAHAEARAAEHEANARVMRAQGREAIAKGGQGVTVTYRDISRDKASIELVFGHVVTEEDLAAMSGAQVGDTIIVDSVGHSLDGFSVKVEGGTIERNFDIERRGDQVILHDHYTGNTGQKSANSGGDIIRGMEHMQRVGVTRVECVAARGNGMNGYYTWAKLGFTGKIPLSSMSSHVVAEMRAKFGNVTRVEQLMQKPGGLQWWKRNGVDWEAHFSFKTPYSIRTLARFKAIVERHGGGNGNSGGE